MNPRLLLSSSSVAPRSCPLTRLALGLFVSAVLAGAATAQCQWLPGQGFDLAGSMVGPGIEVMVEMPNGDVVAGGVFDQIGGVAANHIARWNGTNWTPLGAGTSWIVQAMTVAANGDLIVGGDFNAAGGALAVKVARWDGTTWHAMGAGLPYPVTALAALPGGGCIAGGASAISMWNGASWSTIGTPIFALGPSIASIRALANGDALVAGQFTGIGAVTARNIARWSAATGTWLPVGIGTELNPTLSASPIVKAMAIAANGDVFVGGRQLLGPFESMARWNGTGWSNFANPFPSTVDGVAVLETLPNGRLLASGAISMLASSLQEWDGLAWRSLGSTSPVGTVHGNIEAVLQSSSGAYFAGGGFGIMDGVSSQGIARYDCPISLATVSGYGTGCYDGVATLYESFPGSSFDLSQSTLQLAFDGYRYQVSHVPGAPIFVPPVAPALAMTDDSLSAPISLTFSIPYPGGNTNQIMVGSNGFVYLQPGSDASAFYGNVAGLRYGSARWAPMWGDQDPGPTGGGTVHVDVDAVAQTVLVTWQNVQQYAAPTVLSTFQVIADGSGNVEYRYQACASAFSVLTGWSPGGAARDRVGVDLSVAGPFECRADSLPLQHSPSARPILGTTIGLDTTDVPASSILGATILGVTQFHSGIDLTFLGMPQCAAYASLDVFATAIPSAPTFSYPLSIPNNLALVGSHVYTQGIALVMGLNPFGFISSNGVDLSIGDQ
ncbi:MAG: hypothetical protein K8J09_23075 [Planctomycetes bacterium]|nr:hypothetical protein [Planctomycetota bacterium]